MLTNLGEIESFQAFTSKLKSDFNDCSVSQIKSWEETFFIFKSISNNSILSNVALKFEFEIPLSDGQRVDVLMNVNDSLYIVEFKNKNTYGNEDLSQVKEYYHRIKYYHSHSDGFKLKPILLFNSTQEYVEEKEGVLVVSSKSFINRWRDFSQKLNNKGLDVFLSGDYLPNVEISKYAEAICLDDFTEGLRLPILEESNQLYEKISAIIQKSKEKKRHSIIFVQGEAGSGKTAIGLKLCKHFKGAFISKNGKMIKLLSKRLSHTLNLFSSTAMLKQYFAQKPLPKNHLYVIDEGQRVWGKNRIKQYYDADISEHSILLSHITQMKEWSTTVIFIGIDQQLASSETSYSDTWEEAIRQNNIKTPSLKVYAPYSYELSIKVKKSSKFYLSNSIRSNIKGNFSKFINDLIERPNSKHLQKTVRFINSTKFKMFITRNLNSAQDFIKQNSLKHSTTSCFLGTPFEYENAKKEISIDYKTAHNVNIENCLSSIDHATLPKIKERTLTQFQSLGFEFDYPIIQWNMDYLYYKYRWNYDIETQIMGNGMFYVRNAYRVLLTRGRKGFIVYFPENWEFDKTYIFFKSLGFKELKS